MNLLERKDNHPETLRVLELSQESREVLNIALDEAAIFGETHISTRGLLIGLSQVGRVGEKLRALGMTAETIRETERQIYGVDLPKNLQSPESSTDLQRWKRLPLTLRMHKIGRMVTEKAILSQREVIETEDILAAIIEEGNEVGARVLKALGWSRDF